MTSGTGAAQKALAVNENAGHDCTGHYAVAVIGGHHLEPEEAAIEVVESSRDAHRLGHVEQHLAEPAAHSWRAVAVSSGQPR